MDGLESAFHKAMLDVYSAGQSECDYNANYFLRMLSEHGGLETARRLLRAPGFSDGLTALWECGRLDISVEALILREPWLLLFTEAEQRVARERLSDLGYSVD